MRIIVNQQPQQCDHQCTLQQLVQQLDINPNGLALAVNQQVIAKRLWSEHALQPDDQVVAFQIVTGG
ncbi:sulfur carrier protein ThiS [Alkalimonas collagenimarina]|uniref:Sulfur carrier protein ThiS n=1 Tax=Alkalimonas collagenimarina TaxID=400390 RepID=A0ABT9H0H6_9GAMM|nr:sulfur carrier protein ThiS [Alkalimonas collagenimarina]MDP4536775.1 sulfur carrier protein ThiS [Alkalimonas collagenimarina]